MDAERYSELTVIGERRVVFLDVLDAVSNQISDSFAFFISIVCSRIQSVDCYISAVINAVILGCRVCFFERELRCVLFIIDGNACIYDGNIRQEYFSGFKGNRIRIYFGDICIHIIFYMVFFEPFFCGKSYAFFVLRQETFHIVDKA